MQKQMFHPRKQPYPSIVKAYPRSKLFQLMVIFWGFISALGWLTLIFFLFAEHGSFLIPFILSLSSIFTVLLCMSAIIDHSWECCEENRQAAVQGDQRLLADEQPVPDAQTLPLPTTIGMRPSWGRVIVFIACWLFVGLLMSYWKSWVLGTFSLISVLVTVSPWLIFAVYFLAVYYARTRKQITLTEHGITLAGISPKIRSIPWSEVRLFAISPVGTSFSGKEQSLPPPVIFEVASEHEMIQWHWLRGRGAFLLANPLVPLAEYEQQMNGILAVIKVKTGLPLYDLRKEL
jgi:hypothetical protein